MKYALMMLCASVLVAMSLPARKKKVIFFGDSITQAGVEKGGYITRIGENLQKQGKGADYELIGSGIGGNKVYDLYLRMDSDVLAKKPDIVFVYVGVNDVWHKTLLGTGTDLDKFTRFYSALLRKIKAANAKVIMVTPAVIGEKKDGDNAQDKDLDIYSQALRDLAAQEQCPLVDLRKIFLDFNIQHNTGNEAKGILTTDGVHLNDTGNQLVADKMTESLLNLK
ncbi:SGNH/GDSL hydrolase family protein [Flavihumibacter petaseus]|uniref:Putative esterase n=1 Tax=Flavihumibacter petaseus NBRC 106054 TaxID=1220578 RepID=A0A0E9N082_9BACT|nr:SGNH/GDSL hydrolase family protein [Flavihumibacter petaseus]GAO43259.1 putative esterase [Flavihumibacter petaseus NBRC 106054]